MRSLQVELAARAGGGRAESRMTAEPSVSTGSSSAYIDLARAATQSLSMTAFTPCSRPSRSVTGAPPPSAPITAAPNSRSSVMTGYSLSAPARVKQRRGANPICLRRCASLQRVDAPRQHAGSGRPLRLCRSDEARGLSMRCRHRWILQRPPDAAPRRAASRGAEATHNRRRSHHVGRLGFQRATRHRGCGGRR